MVTVEFPFPVLRNLPGAGDLPTTEVELPEPEDIQEIVASVLEDEGLTTDTLLDGLADADRQWGAVLNDGLSEALFDRPRGNLEPSPLLADIASEIAKEVDIEGVTSDDIIASVLDALEVDDGDIVLSIEGSLFATDSDFEDLLERAIEDADINGGGGGVDIPDLLNPIDELVDLVDGLADDIAALPGDVADEVVDQVADAVQEAVDEALELGPLEDIDEFVDGLVDALVERLVSQEASEGLQETLEEI